MFSKETDKLDDLHARAWRKQRIDDGIAELHVQLIYPPKSVIKQLTPIQCEYLYRVLKNHHTSVLKAADALFEQRITMEWDNDE